MDMLYVTVTKLKVAQSVGKVKKENERNGYLNNKY